MSRSRMLSDLGLCLCVPCAAAAAQSVPLLTRAERSGFENTSRHEDVLAFMATLAERTRLACVETFGTSEEGRDLPLFVIGAPPRGVT